MHLTPGCTDDIFPVAVVGAGGPRYPWPAWEPRQRDSTGCEWLPRVFGSGPRRPLARRRRCVLSESLAVAVLNHNRTRDAIAIRALFAPHAPCVLIDSGSALGPSERESIDIALPNVHYSGMLREAVRRFADARSILFVASDVRVADAHELVARAVDALSSHDVGAWAPSAQASAHPSMVYQATKRARRAPFVEGFCFAAKMDLLGELPIDTELNSIGWGLDVHLGYLAACRRSRCLVDDRVQVFHPRGSAYDKADARMQRDAWYAERSASARLFRRLTGFRSSHNERIATLIAGLPWPHEPPREDRASRR